MPTTDPESVDPRSVEWGNCIARFDALLSKIEASFYGGVCGPNWDESVAFRYQKKRFGQASLVPVRHVGHMAPEHILAVDVQKEKIFRNTQQFVNGRPANNVLLTGARGTGKSSLIRACLHAFSGQGLRLIEIDKSDLLDLADIVDVVANRPEKFIIFCDDLSFDDGDGNYKALKSILDGSIAASSANVLIYATSNRRHLLPEYHSENQRYKPGGTGEIHPSEAVEEKVSLSERFGLWISFYPFSQEEYLSIVNQWLRSFGVPSELIEPAHPEARVWALERGARNGRVAYHFARDYVGRNRHGYDGS